MSILKRGLVNEEGISESFVRELWIEKLNMILILIVLPYQWKDNRFVLSKMPRKILFFWDFTLQLYFYNRFHRKRAMIKCISNVKYNTSHLTPVRNRTVNTGPSRLKQLQTKSIICQQWITENNKGLTCIFSFICFAFLEKSLSHVA